MKLTYEQKCDLFDALGIAIEDVAEDERARRYHHLRRKIRGAIKLENPEDARVFHRDRAREAA